MPVTIQSVEAAALERAYIASAGRMLAQIQAISGAPNSQMQRSLARLDAEAARLAEAEERMTADNPQLQQTMGEYEQTFKTTQALILANDNTIQNAAAAIAIPAVTAKVFSVITSALFARGINPLSPQAAKVYASQVAGSGIPWVTPSALDFAGGYVDSPAWASRMENWGAGYADMSRDTFANGIAKGWGPQYTASQVRLSAENLPKSASESLTRTLQLTSYRDASAAMELQNGKYITGKIRISALKETSCLTCISLHGTPLAVGERVDDHYRGFCSEFYQVPGGPQYPDQMQADSKPGDRQFVPFQTGEEWFASLPPERQARQASFLRSPAKLRAYRDGTPLSAFVGDHTDDVFGHQVVERSLKNAVGLSKAQGYYVNGPVKRAFGDAPSDIILRNKQEANDIISGLDYDLVSLSNDNKVIDGYMVMGEYNEITKNVTIYKSAWEGLEEQELKGVMAHEIMHSNFPKTADVLKDAAAAAKSQGADVDTFINSLKGDGWEISAYAEYHWNQVSGKWSGTAATETLCEMHRQVIAEGAEADIFPQNWAAVYRQSIARLK